MRSDSAQEPPGNIFSPWRLGPGQRGRSVRGRPPRRSGPGRPSRHCSHPGGPRPARGQLRRLRGTPGHPPPLLGPAAALPRGPGPLRAPCARPAPVLPRSRLHGAERCARQEEGRGGPRAASPSAGSRRCLAPRRVPQRPLAPDSVASRWVGAGVRYGCGAAVRSR